MVKERKLVGNINWDIGVGEFEDGDTMYYIANSGTPSFAISFTEREFSIFCDLIKEAKKMIKEKKNE